MIETDLDKGVARLRELIDSADAIVPFTGAGISTECGIPDFRSPGGIWTKNQPIYFDDFISSQEMRDEAWKRRFAMEEYFAKATPGRGHLALASFYKAGKVPGLITQNIDNLHQASGIAPNDIVELHGNTTYATCLTAASATRSRGCARNMQPGPTARPIAAAAASSRRQQCHSARRCRKLRCSARKT